MSDADVASGQVLHASACGATIYQNAKPTGRCLPTQCSRGLRPQNAPSGSHGSGDPQRVVVRPTPAVLLWRHTYWRYGRVWGERAQFVWSLGFVFFPGRLVACNQLGLQTGRILQTAFSRYVCSTGAAYKDQIHSCGYSEMDL